MVQIAAVKRMKGRAPLSVVVAIIGGLALAGVIFTDDLRSLTGTCTCMQHASSTAPTELHSTAQSACTMCIYALG